MCILDTELLIHNTSNIALSMFCHAAVGYGDINLNQASIQLMILSCAIIVCYI
jgi:hypothetical protein